MTVYVIWDCFASEALISGDYSSCDEEWLLVIAHTQIWNILMSNLSHLSVI